MKQNLLLTSLFLSATLFCAKAETVTTTIDDVNYAADTEGTTAMVTKSSSASGDVAIPETVEIEGVTYTVTALDASAFSSNSKITSVKLPATVTVLGDKAFNLCSKLAQVNIPDGVTELGTNLFGSCKLLESIEIPASVTTLGTNVFRKCESLKSIELSENIESIGSGCFEGCIGITSIIIPYKVTSLSENVLSGCSALETIILTDAITTIGDGAFNGTAIAKITLPSQLTGLGQAFESCANLTSIAIPDGVSVIQGSTFNNCSALETVALGSGITAINEFAFNQCSAIKEISISATTPPALSEGAFPSAVYTNASLTVPDGCEDAYKAAEVWSKFNIQSLILDVTASDSPIIELYTITGSKVSENYHGVVIARRADGTVIKAIKR